MAESVKKPIDSNEASLEARVVSEAAKDSQEEVKKQEDATDHMLKKVIKEQTKPRPSSQKAAPSRAPSGTSSSSSSASSSPAHKAQSRGRSKRRSSRRERRRRPSEAPSRPPVVFTRTAPRSSLPGDDTDLAPMQLDSLDTRRFRIKFLQVCDDFRWDAECVARALEGDAKFAAPTIMEVVTHLSISQAIRAVDEAIHPQLRVYFDDLRSTFRVCMPFPKQRSKSAKAKKDGRPAQAGPAPPRAPPPARSAQTQWRPTLRPASSQNPKQLWSGAVSRPRTPFSVWPVDHHNLMDSKPKAGFPNRSSPKAAGASARAPPSARARRNEPAAPEAPVPSFAPSALAPWIGPDSGTTSHDGGVSAQPRHSNRQASAEPRPRSDASRLRGSADIEPSDRQAARRLRTRHDSSWRVH